MKLLLGLASLGLASAVSAATKVSYDGWKVYRVNVGSNAAEFSKLVNDVGLETWKGKPASSAVVDVMVSPSQLEAFEKAAEGLQVNLMHDNLGQSISTEAAFPVYTGIYPSNDFHMKRGANIHLAKRDIGISPYAAPNSTWFDSYHSIADHMQFIKDLAASYPDNAEVISAGKSTEGRDIVGIHIYGSKNNTKPGVVWHGTVHAREWITTMVCKEHP